MQTAAKFIDTSDLWMKGRSWAISKKWGWMASIATGMMKRKIDKANIPSLADLQEMAQIEGVELVACKMTVDMMEIDEKKLIAGVVVWTAEDFIKYARECKICLFT